MLFKKRQGRSIMEKDWKYKIEHVGDLVADWIEAAIDAASGSVSGVVIGYHIQKIDKKKGKMATRIGGRVIEMRKDNPDLLSYDEQMVTLFTDLDELLTARDHYLKEREEKKQRVKRCGVIFEPEDTAAEGKVGTATA
jgi:hypothetical protein